MTATSTVFLLSPAYCGGKRAQMLLGGRGEFDLAVKCRDGVATIGEVFSFLSGLYFRGKLAYGTKFGRSLVITPGRGLLSPDTVVGMDELRAMAEISVDLDE